MKQVIVKIILRDLIVYEATARGEDAAEKLAQNVCDYIKSAIKSDNFIDLRIEFSGGVGVG